MVLKMLALENSLVAQCSGLGAFTAGAHIQSLVGQLGCCKLHGAKKKKKVLIAVSAGSLLSEKEIHGSQFQMKKVIEKIKLGSLQISGRIKEWSLNITEPGRASKKNAQTSISYSRVPTTASQISSCFLTPKTPGVCCQKLQKLTLVCLQSQVLPLSGLSTDLIFSTKALLLTSVLAESICLVQQFYTSRTFAAKDFEKYIFSLLDSAVQKLC